MNDGYTTKLDHFFKKSIRCKHLHENYKDTLGLDLKPAGLKIKKLPVIIPVVSNFYREWNEILCKAEKELVNPLLTEFSKVAEKTQKRRAREIKIQYPLDYKFFIRKQFFLPEAQFF